MYKRINEMKTRKMHACMHTYMNNYMKGCTIEQVCDCVLYSKGKIDIF